MIRVEGHSHLYRDEQTGAIINYDDDGYNNYLNSVNSKKKKQKELNEMKQDIEDIKGALKEILNRLA